MYLVIAYNKSRREQIIAYVIDPTTLEYGTHDVQSTSFFDYTENR